MGGFKKDIYPDIDLSRLVFATNNPHKIKEVKMALPASFNIMSLADIGCFEELPETHHTIEENSMEKADYVFNKYGSPCFAEDSGLEVFALGGEPGVHSAYYSGSRNADENMRLLLRNLIDVEKREAQFKTVFTLVTSRFREQFMGIVTGKIIYQPRGSAGFGYDPIFIPDGYQHTFAEMSASEKNSVSHRSKACKLLTGYIQLYFRK
ncbi:MAG: RdgB/HAM1 family non-canonical purine NTP pyrophosphatase [Chitinophagales bacterium]|nr:RdgB/HAM1 family non-canonical purine NTP pyrophosphatase [Chitinophagales bacterium]